MNSGAVKKKKPRALLSADRRKVTLKLNLWSETFDVDLLESRIKFFSDMEARKGGKYCQHYQATTKALIGVRERLTGCGGVKS